MSTADGGATAEQPRLRRMVLLGGLAAVVALLPTFGVLPRHSALLHLVALPPLGLLTDVRLLVAAAPSYPAFIVGVVVSLTVRTSLLALLLGSLRGNARFATTLYAVALGPALLAALLQFAGQAAFYARLLWPAPMVMAVTLALLAPTAWQHRGRLRSAARQTLRHGLRVDVLVPYGLLLVGLGAVADAWGTPAAGVADAAAAAGAAGAAAADAGGGTAVTPGNTVVMVAAVFLSAAATFVAIEALAAPPPTRPVVLLAAVAVAGTALALLVDESRQEGPVVAPQEREGSLLLMSGINSSSGSGAIFEVHPSVYGYPCERTFHYSYAGVGDGAPQRDSACPITTGAPYGAVDTQRPLDALTATFAHQVAELPPPVTVIAHSQAPWIAWQALAEHPDLDVGRLVLLGPFPDNSLGYPPPRSAGPGRIGGDGIRLLASFGQALGFGFDPNAPLARELLATPGASRRVLSQPLPENIDVLEIPAIVDLPLRSRGSSVDGAVTACPARTAHPYLPLAGETHVALHRFQAGEPLPVCPRWRVVAGHAGRSLALPPLHEPPRR